MQPTALSAGTAHLLTLPSPVEFRLDDADDPVARQRVVEHLQVAWLENVERHLSARQKQRPAQRKEAHRFG